MTKQVACIISNSGIVNVVINGKHHSIAPDHVNYKMVIKAIKDTDHDALVDLVDIPKAVESFTAGSVSIVDGQVQYAGQSIHNAIATRILGLMRDDMPFKFMVNFLDNLMLNPSYRAVNELYDFLEFANIPITDDGCFLAYKRVKQDYKDIHSGSIDNSVGQTPKMLRNMVDEDKGRTCSNGLHFCSLDYIPSFGSTQDESTDRVMIVKIDPKDVVAIPADYNNTKGRCCQYEVVAEYDGDWKKDAFTKAVHCKDGTPYGDDREYDDDGYDEDGYDDDGYDADGYDADGYDYDGYDSDGYDQGGFDPDGYDSSGYDADGYDREGYDENDYDEDGNNRDDKYCPSCGAIVVSETTNGEPVCDGCGFIQRTAPDDIPEDDNDSGHNLSNAKRYYGVRNANGQPIRRN